MRVRTRVAIAVDYARMGGAVQRRTMACSIGAAGPASQPRHVTDGTDFEYGEFTVHRYDHVQFRLRARAPHRIFDTSQPVVLSRSKPR